MVVCNACRYCEAYCPVFQAMEERVTFASGDLAYLANLCHNCGECLYACQYAPPHEFGIDVPRTLSKVRVESYEASVWPPFAAIAFRRPWATTFAALAVGVLISASVGRPFTGRQENKMPAPPQGRLGIFPGSFDPLTNGHVDIILRSAHLFERIIVAVLVNAEKNPLFSADERVAIIREVFKEYPNIEVDTFDGLLVEYARRRRASALIRGLRAVSDFEYEFQMALMNRHLEPTLETVFMMPAEQYTYLSSRLIKEVFSLGGDVSGLVPSTVEQWMRRKHSAVGA